VADFLVLFASVKLNSVNLGRFVLLELYQGEQCLSATRAKRSSPCKKKLTEEEFKKFVGIQWCGEIFLMFASSNRDCCIFF